MSKNSRLNLQKKRKKKILKQKQKIALIQKRREKKGYIYLDESGNTGSNLIDANQPVFVLASICLSKNESVRLLDLITSNVKSEIHFKTLRRSNRGRESILRLLKHSLVSPQNIKVVVFHKQYMILTKIVDLLIEHMAFINDFDLYKNGLNIALSNMLHCCIPSFCGQHAYEKMLCEFVEMIRSKDDEKVKKFYKTVKQLKELSNHDKFEHDIDLILLTKHYVREALESIDKSALDPAIPGLFTVCDKWGKVFPSGFHIIHDNSNTVEEQEGLFKLFFDFTQKDVTLGYDRRKFNLPLKGLSLAFEDSKLFPQLQLSDIIASSICYWARSLSLGNTEDPFFIELNKLNFRDFVVNLIWPSQEVTPAELKTEYHGGTHPDRITNFLEKARANINLK